MKNTLAENMLRFGVKNLSESNIKKISEASLIEAPTPYAPYADQTATGLTFKDEATWNAACAKVDSFTGYTYDVNYLIKQEGFGRAFLDTSKNPPVATVPNAQIQAILANLAQGMFYTSVFLGRKDCNWASTIGGAKLKATAALKTFRPKAPSQNSILPGVSDLCTIDGKAGTGIEVPFAGVDKGLGLGLPANTQYGDSRWSAIFKTVKTQVEAALSMANAPVAAPAKPTTTAPGAPGKTAPGAAPTTGN